MSKFQFANVVPVLLALAINTTETTVKLSDASSFPPIGIWTLRLDDEILLVTEVAGNELTVQRGAEGTTAAEHDQDTLAYGVVSAGALNTFRQFAVTNLSGPTVSFDARQVETAFITTAFDTTISAPENPTDGQPLILLIKNTSLGAINITLDPVFWLAVGLTNPNMDGIAYRVYSCVYSEAASSWLVTSIRDFA